jgi:release factor glutamine methyltransferase
MEPAANLVKNIMEEFQRKLAGIYPQQEIRQFAYILFESFLGWQKTRVHLSYDQEIPSKAMDAFNNALEKLRTGTPVQYITGSTSFNGAIIKVSPAVLIPRPETEELCLIIKSDYPAPTPSGFSILEVGTGSGCIAIDLKSHFKNAAVDAIDISSAALELAQANALANKCNIVFREVSILDRVGWGSFGNYSLIVSNPPYVLESEKAQMHKNVLDFEPGQALFVTDTDPLLFYTAIVDFALLHLVRPARLYFEINERYGSEIYDLALAKGFDKAAIIKDFQGKDRFISAWLF